MNRTLTCCKGSVLYWYVFAVISVNREAAYQSFHKTCQNSEVCRFFLIYLFQILHEFDTISLWRLSNFRVIILNCNLTDSGFGEICSCGFEKYWPVNWYYVRNGIVFISIYSFIKVSKVFKYEIQYIWLYKRKLKTLLKSLHRAIDY